MTFDLQSLPVWQQSQESLSAQMAALVQIANRLGLHDAADAVKQMTPKLDTVRYGCHLELEHGAEPDGCVIDTGDYINCFYAKLGMKKEQCEYWKVVTTKQADAEPEMPNDDQLDLMEAQP